MDFRVGTRACQDSKSSDGLMDELRNVMNSWYIFPFSEKTISDSTLCEAVLASVLSEGVKTNVYQEGGQ